ncbi:glycosyltransferase family protein [Oribacterium sp. NK2B42]|uniref:glycosyltransferase family protein n=1 Tax=Oribacterium sp. NK2B42 TaxID=689781 RepID=UPI0004276997|nr:glycosyltransferase [Oribacterium sp. NK2B42]
MTNIIVTTMSEENNGLINFFTDQWVNSLKKLPDIYVKVVNIDTCEGLDNELDIIIENKNCILLCYNCCGIPFTYDNNQNVWESHDIPVYTFLLDHPRNYYAILENPINNLHVICLDENHVEFIQRFYPKVNETIFLPDSGVKVCNKIKSFSDRTIDVLYCGNCQTEYKTLLPVRSLPDDGIEMYRNAIKFIHSNPSLTAEEAVEMYLDAAGIKADDSMLYSLFIKDKVSRQIEDIVRREYKLLIMHALDDAGIKVDIYGGGWEDDSNPFSDNIRIHERVSPLECHNLIGNAKIDLSIMPWFKKGSSEKPFGGMLNGAVCVSDSSTYLKENYVDGTDIILFELDNIEKAVKDIQWLLSNPDEAEIIALNGYYHALDQDGTDARIREIVELLMGRRKYNS